MLPYRLRPPVYGGKLKEKKKQEAEAVAKNGGTDGSIEPAPNDPLHGGGPLQRAIELDLLELRTKFVRLLQDFTPDGAGDKHGNDDDGVTNLRQRRCHVERGQVFRMFKMVFGEAKIALLHSRLIPPRCEREAYSQLIYAACLSLLKKSYAEPTFCLEHAVFAVFCLYTLYQTNPLAMGPDVSSMNHYDHQRQRHLLTMLPMGLQNVENPKALYRRAFRTFIRIDRYHYSLLLRLVEECRARQGECQSHARIVPHQDTGQWRCTCGVATDGIEIVTRVLKTLDFAEYTGPCSVEGLAGHADYAFSSAASPPMQNTSTTGNGINVTSVMTMDEINQVGTTILPFQLNEAFLTGMKDYRDKVQGIRLPPLKSNLTTSESRIRKALIPMFGDDALPWSKLYDNLSLHSGKDLLSSLQDGDTTTVRRIKRNVVSFQIQTGEPSEAAESDTVAGSVVRDTSADHKPDVPEGLDSVGEGAVYKIVLPSGLPMPTQEGIEMAIQSILVRNPNAWQDKDAATEKGQSIELSIRQEDNVSTRDDDGVSAMSENTGQGRAALRNLLTSAAAAKACSLNATSQPSETSDQLVTEPQEDDNASSRSQITGQGRAALHSLLTSAVAAKASIPTARNSRVGHQDEEASTASQITSPGRAALRKLLVTATAETASNATPLNSPISRRELEEEEEASESTQITGPGRAAFRSLLSSVVAADPSQPQGSVFSVDPSDQFLFGNLDDSGENFGCSRFLSSDEPSDLSDPSENEVSDEDDDDVSTAVSTVGRRALHTLLSAVSPPKATKAKSKRKGATSNRAKSKPEKRTRRSVPPTQAEAEELPPSRGAGTAALEELLSRVAGPEEGQDN